MDEEIRPEQPLEQSSEKQRVARRNVLIGGVTGFIAGLVARVRGAEASHVPQAPVLMEEINIAPHGGRTTLLGPYSWLRLDDPDGASESVQRPAVGSVWDLQSGFDPTAVPVIPATLEVVTARPGTIPFVVHQMTAGEPAAHIRGPVDAEEVRCLDLTVGGNFSCGTVGSAICPAGTDNCVVQSSVCTQDSYVGATCTADIPRTFIQCVEPGVPGAGQFTVRLNRVAHSPVPIAFFVANPLPAQAP